MDTEGVYVGRLNPMHIGHEAIIHTMQEIHGRKNCVVMLGSCTAPYSERDMFSYVQRREFVKIVFPDISIVGLPDFKSSDEEWLTNMDDMLRFAGVDPTKATYYGGCPDEYHMQLFAKVGKKIHIVTRHDERMEWISGSAVRAALALGERPLFNRMMNPLLRDFVYQEGLCILRNHAYDY